MEKRVCRKCLLEDLDDKELASLIREAILAVPEAERVDEAVYRERLGKCRNCDHLMNGLCMQSGYYVDVRAIRKTAACRFW